MTTATIYIADDGRRFNDELKCKEYEEAGCIEFHPIPPYGDRIRLSSLRTDDLSWLVDGDGDGYYATDDQMSRSHRIGSAPHPGWATQIIYFGK